MGNSKILELFDFNFDSSKFSDFSLLLLIISVNNSTLGPCLKGGGAF